MYVRLYVKTYSGALKVHQKGAACTKLNYVKVVKNKTLINK